MSNVSKGTANEKKCEDILKAFGYKTWRTRRQRFGNMDMFGLFDVVALFDSTEVDSLSTPHMRFIQVKTNYCPPKVFKAIEALNLPPRCSREVWVWKDRLEDFDITLVTK